MLTLKNRRHRPILESKLGRCLKVNARVSKIYEKENAGFKCTEEEKQLQLQSHFSLEFLWISNRFLLYFPIVLPVE